MFLKWLLFFFLFCFFQTCCSERKVETINNYLKTLEKKIESVNEKNPNLLQPTQKSLLSCMLHLQKYLIDGKKEQLQAYLKKNLSKNWMDFIQEEILRPMVRSINNRDNNQLQQLFKEINQNSFKKNIQNTMVKNSGKSFDGKILWMQYQYLILAILVGDYFKIDVPVDFEDTTIFFSNPKLIVHELTKNNKKKQKYIHLIDGFLNDYLVKFAIDFNTFEDGNLLTELNNQAKLSPMDNGAFLQTFKDAPFTSNNLSTIEINGPMRTLTTKHQKNKGKTIHKKIKFIIILLGVSIGFFFIYDLYKTTNRQPMKILLKSIEKLITTISFKIKKLAKENQIILLANG